MKGSNFGIWKPEFSSWLHHSVIVCEQCLTVIDPQGNRILSWLNLWNQAKMFFFFLILRHKGWFIALAWLQFKSSFYQDTQAGCLPQTVLPSTSNWAVQLLFLPLISLSCNTGTLAPSCLYTMALYDISFCPFYMYPLYPLYNCLSVCLYICLSVCLSFRGIKGLQLQTTHLKSSSY